MKSSYPERMKAGVNWAGICAYRACGLEAPQSVDALEHLVASSPRVRVLGSRHCFDLSARLATNTPLSGQGKAVSVARLILNPEIISVRSTVRDFLPSA